MSRKLALRAMVMEGMAMVPNILHLFSTDGTTIMSPFSPYASFLMTTMWDFSWLKGIISGCDCVIPHVDGKIVRSNTIQ